MLKIEINGKKYSIDVEGDLKQICTEFAGAICGLHDSLRQSDPASARAFQTAVKALVNDPNTPVWDATSAEGVMIDLSEIKRKGGKGR